MAIKGSAKGFKGPSYKVKGGAVKGKATKGAGKAQQWGGKAQPWGGKAQQKGGKGWESKGYGGKGWGGKAQQWPAEPAGQWVFLASEPTKSKGKGKGKDQKGKGKGKSEKDLKNWDKLSKMDASLKVWVGGLPTDTTVKKLVEHFATVAKPGLIHLMSKGTAVVTYKTAEDVEAAIASLNGSDFGDKTLEVDVWTQKEKTEKSEKPAKKHTLKIKKTFLKGAPPSAQHKKILDELRETDPSLKVYVGDLAKAVTSKDLEKHFAEVVKPTLIHVGGKGTGVAAFETAEDAETAVSSLNGSELKGKSILVDVWTKPERTERIKKETAA